LLWNVYLCMHHWMAC